VVRQGKVSRRLEKMGVWEKIIEKIQDRILKERETFPTGEETCEGEEEEGKTGGRFANDFVT